MDDRSWTEEGVELDLWELVAKGLVEADTTGSVPRFRITELGQRVVEAGK